MRSTMWREEDALRPDVSRDEKLPSVRRIRDPSPGVSQVPPGVSRGVPRGVPKWGSPGGFPGGSKRGFPGGSKRVRK